MARKERTVSEYKVLASRKRRRRGSPYKTAKGILGEILNPPPKRKDNESSREWIQSAYNYLKYSGHTPERQQEIMMKVAMAVFKKEAIFQIKKRRRRGGVLRGGGRLSYGLRKMKGIPGAVVKAPFRAAGKVTRKVVRTTGKHGLRAAAKGGFRIAKGLGRAVKRSPMNAALAYLMGPEMIRKARQAGSQGLQGGGFYNKPIFGGSM